MSATCETGSTPRGLSQFEICLGQPAGEVVVVAAGEIDLCNAEDFRTTLFAAAGQGGARFTVDLTDVNFMDCSGLNAIVAAKSALPDGCVLTVRADSAVTRRLFEITGLSALLEDEG